MKNDKKFAWLPLKTKNNEIVWLKNINFETKYVEHKYNFILFGGETSISIGYDKKIYSKIN